MAVHENNNLSELAFILALSKAKSGSEQEIHQVVDDYLAHKSATEEEVIDVINGLDDDDEDFEYATDEEIDDVINGLFSG